MRSKAIFNVYIELAGVPTTCKFKKKELKKDFEKIKAYIAPRVSIGSLKYFSPFGSAVWPPIVYTYM